ncbi:MAG TPA: DUF302 domain-containing protein [Polyangiales bacterium]|nr:DUF302 domain-containing protein [Polyangiales bacterium]
MTTLSIEHVDVITPHTYERATALFTSLVPFADQAEIAKLTSGAEVTAMMQRRAGELGILIMAALEQGPIISLLGQPRHLAVYLIGSPLLGARLFAEHRAAGLYAPAHVTLYEHADGHAHFAYDRPSTLLAQFGAAAQDLGKLFDAKLATLADHLTR